MAGLYRTRDEKGNERVLPFLYAVLDPWGSCWVVLDGATEKVEGIVQLLGMGYRPVRETPFHGDPSYILILLEAPATVD